MHDQDGSRGNATGQIDPFSGGWLDTITRLRNEMIAVRDEVGKFFLEPDPADADLERRVTDAVALYDLDENDRHPAIRQSAVAAAGEIARFAQSRADMGNDYIWTAGVVAQKFEVALLKQINTDLQRFGNELLGVRTISDVSQAVQHLIDNTDPASLAPLGRYAAECALAGNMIDAGNEFLNVNAEWRAVLELYASGRAPAGWSQRLPGRLKSIFSEVTWATIEQVLDKLAELGVWHVADVVPFGAIAVLPVRVYLEVRDERAREDQAHRRGDVDELLDLTDQLAMASGEARRLRDAVGKVSQAAAKI